MVLTFLGVYLSFLSFQVSSFSKSVRLDFIANDEWPQFTQPQSTGLGGTTDCAPKYGEKISGNR